VLLGAKCGFFDCLHIDTIEDWIRDYKSLRISFLTSFLLSQFINQIFELVLTHLHPPIEGLELIFPLVFGEHYYDVVPTILILHWRDEF